MRLRQTMHRPVLRCRRQALREGMTERDSSHEQHRTKRVRRVFHRQRHSLLRPRQAVRQGVAFHDTGPELPRAGSSGPAFPRSGTEVRSGPRTDFSTLYHHRSREFMAAASELYRRTIAVSEAGKRIRLKS